MIIHQGSTYKIPFNLKFNGKVLTADEVKQVEFAFGEVIKNYPEHATFDGEHFVCPLTQEDTFALDAKKTNEYQVRVMFNDGSVKPTAAKQLSVIKSVSKEVLK